MSLLAQKYIYWTITIGTVVSVRVQRCFSEKCEKALSKLRNLSAY
jgi:hypothetical protein